LVRSDLVERSPSTTVYPTPIDGPSIHQQWPEQVLWFYPFAPGSAGMTLPDDVDIRPPALPLSTTDATALNNAGLALHEIGRQHEALRHFDRALELAPGTAVIVYNRGNTLVALQRLDEAVAAYDDALAANPDDVGVLNNRACALGALGRFEEALASLDRAAALKPDDPTTMTNREVLAQAMTQAERLVSAARVEVVK
jgi:tetratricopeptide (TPR) repeat protein